MLGVVMGLTALCLETYLFLVLSSFVALLASRKIFKLYSNFPVILVSFFLTLFFLNPGIIKTGGGVTSWLMYAYRIFFRNGEEYQGVNWVNNWLEFGSVNLYFSIFILAVFCSYLVFFKKIEIPVKVLLITSIGYLLLITPFNLNTTYLFPGLLITSFSCLLVLLNIFERLSGEK
ncbi:MAG: hypothetical protein Q3M24_17970 [Candidatus Electrothrix aestuarii]|uniref:Polymerase n=1 Tax=Candidatus Electrothrix aestuarii TaxID=3062594 RepID=A0AAU8LSP5_9BACT